MNRKMRDYDDWFNSYEPVLNTLDRNAAYEGYMFETYGNEVALVKQHPNDHIWTLIATEGNMYLSPGFHLVNRLGYFICAKPFIDAKDIRL